MSLLWAGQQLQSSALTGSDGMATLNMRVAGAANLPAGVVAAQPENVWILARHGDDAALVTPWCLHLQPWESTKHKCISLHGSTRLSAGPHLAHQGHPADQEGRRASAARRANGDADGDRAGQQTGAYEGAARLRTWNGDGGFDARARRGAWLLFHAVGQHRSRRLLRNRQFLRGGVQEARVPGHGKTDNSTCAAREPDSGDDRGTLFLWRASRECQGEIRSAHLAALLVGRGRGR